MIKKKYVIGTLAILVLTMSGCVDTTVCGTYELGGSLLTLHEDNTYLYTPTGGFAQKGTFTQYEGSIEITNVLGMTTILNITRFGLVDDEGGLWRKQDVKLQNT